MSQQAKRLSKAARNLLDFISEYSGDNADWPVQIRFDDMTYANAFCTMLNDLEVAAGKISAK